MILALRNRHKWMWLILTILLPLGFITAYSLSSQIPEAVNENLPAIKPTPLSKIQSIQQTPQFDIQLREDNNMGLKQIEVTLKEASKRPSTHLYLSDKSAKGIEQAEFLGVLGSKGIYRFNLNPSVTYQQALVLLFYDKIGGEVFEEVQLQ